MQHTYRHILKRYKKPLPETRKRFLRINSDLLLDLGGLAGAAAQVEQLCTANLTAANNLNVLDARAVDREHTLNTNTIRGAADGEGLRDAAMLLSNIGTFDSLDSLLVAFLDTDGHADGIADFKLGLVLFDHALGHFLHCVH